MGGFFALGLICRCRKVLFYKEMNCHCLQVQIRKVGAYSTENCIPN